MSLRTLLGITVLLTAPTITLAGVSGCTGGTFTSNVNGGGTLKFPVGVITLNSTCTITGSGIKVTGQGMFATTIVPNFASGDVFFFNGSGSSGGIGSANEISDIGIQNTSLSSTGRTGVDINNQNTFTAERLYLQSVTTGINVTGSSSYLIRLININISGLQGTSSSVNGIVLNGAGEFRVLDTYMGASANTANAGIMLSSGGAYLTDVDIVGFKNGLLINPGSGQTVAFSEIKNGVFDTCDQDCVLIQPSSGGDAHSTMFVDSWSSSAKNNGFNCVQGSGATVNGLQLTGHRAYNSTYNGINIQGCNNVTIEASRVSQNSVASAGTYDGIHVVAGTSNFSIRNSTSEMVDDFALNTQGYGINIESGSSNAYQLVGNVLTNNVNGELNDLGTGVIRTIANNGIGVPTIGSGSSINLGAFDPDVVNLTGSATITSITPVWDQRRVTFVNVGSGTITISSVNSTTLGPNSLVQCVYFVGFSGWLCK